MKKRVLIILVIIIAAVILVIAGWYFSRRTPSSNPVGGDTNNPSGVLPVVTSTPLESFPTGPTFDIATPQGSVVVNNFYKTAAEITPDEKAVRFTDATAYSIIYDRQDSSFAISLLRLPLAATQAEAESAFLQSLGISREEACKLSVIVAVPASVDPENAGKDFGLSFCSARIQSSQ